MRPRPAHAVQPALVDGVPGLILAPHSRLTRTLRFTFAHDRVVAVNVIGDPERLRALSNGSGARQGTPAGPAGGAAGRTASVGARSWPGAAAGHRCADAAWRGRSVPTMRNSEVLFWAPCRSQITLLPSRRHWRRVTSQQQARRLDHRPVGTGGRRKRPFDERSKTSNACHVAAAIQGDCASMKILCRSTLTGVSGSVWRCAMVRAYLSVVRP